MPTSLTLNVAQARALHLAAQGMLTRPRARARKASVLAAIEQMQLLQIDTINVVARSPYLVLFSRLGTYRTEWLDQLLAKGAIFETWAHEACFAPTADYRWHRDNDRAHHWSAKMAQRIHGAHREDMDKLLAQVRASGPVKSSDFESGEVRGGGWWGWKAEKRWLESWFALGELMVLRRDSFQRVYDVTERVIGRVLADWNADAFPAAQVQRELTLRAVKALGITQARWIADYFRLGKRYRDADLEALLASGELLRVDVKGWDAPAYVHSDHLEIAEKAAKGKLRALRTVLLSPFDPLVWDRERASTLFGFDYRLECYTPGPKRIHGYFVLPILHRGRLIGRLDAKAHRAEGRFEVKAIFLEAKVRVDAALTEAVAGAIQECADWHGTPSVTITKSEPREWVEALREQVAG